MITIWKFELGERPGVQEVFMPWEIVHVGWQTRVTFWAKVDTAAPKKPFHFEITGTGWELPEDSFYCGTVQAPGGLVWHISQVCQEHL